MTIARLAETLGANNAVAGNYDIAVPAPAATPNAVCVVIVLSGTGGNTDLVTSVTYGTGAGAVPLTERRWSIESTEAGGVYIYWAAGVVFPSGAQTVRIVRTGTTALRAAVCPMTVAAGMQVAVDVDNFGTSASLLNPTWPLVTTVAVTECYLGIHSGNNAMTATPATNWTLIGSDDLGNFGRGWARRTGSATGDKLPGWIVGADDFVGVAVAFKEAPLSSAVTLTPAALTLAPVALSFPGGASTVTLTPAPLQLAALPLVATPTVALTPAALALAPVPLGFPAPSTVTLTPAPLQLAALPLVATPTVALTPAALALAARPIIPGPFPPVDGIGYDGAGVGVTSFTRTSPAAVADGDLGFLVVGYVVAVGNEAIAVTAESGTGKAWSAVLTPVGANNMGFAFLYRVKQAGDSSTITVTLAGTRAVTAALEWYADAGGVGVVGALGNRAGVSSTTTTAPGITAGAAGRRIVELFAERTSTEAGTTVALDQGLARQYLEGTGGSTCSVLIGDFVAPAAATGSVTATYSGAASGNGVGVLVELVPPAGGASAVTLTPATFSLAPMPLVATPAVTLTAAPLVLTGRPLAATPAVALTPAALVLAPRPLMLTPTLLLTPAPLQLTPVALGTGSASLLTLTPAGLVLTGRPLVATPAVTLTPAGLVLTPRPLTATPAVALAAAALTLAPRPLVLTPVLALTPAGLVLTGVELGLAAAASRDVWVRLHLDAPAAILIEDLPRCSMSSPAVDGMEA